MTRERLGPSPSIDQIRDDVCYELADSFAYEQTNLFFNVGRLGQIFIKTPTERGLHDYRAFVRDDIVTDSAIRPLEDEERYVSGDELAHYLHVHKLQYQRLRESGLIGIPEARFAWSSKGPNVPTSQRPNAPTSERPHVPTSPGPNVPTSERPNVPTSQRPNAPTVFQERIPGSTLWEIFDFEAQAIRKAWQPFKETIARQLQGLLESPLVTHVDWNIKNFIFHGAEQRLYYVDSKPTTFVEKAGNEQNIAGIRTHFLA